ncbi:MAG: hypothetical protein ACI83B_001076 [Sediminicola sp.]|jgi:hypothetical protein
MSSLGRKGVTNRPLGINNLNVGNFLNNLKISTVPCSKTVMASLTRPT